MTGPNASLACDAVRADLVAWLDDELDDARATAIRAHLEGCAGCCAERDALAGVWKDLDALPALEPRAGLFAEVEAAVRAEAGAAAGGRLIRFPFAAKAAGLAAALLITAGGAFALTQLLSAPPEGGGGGRLAVQPLASPSAPPDPLELPPAPDAPEAPTPDAPAPRRVKVPREAPAPSPAPERATPEVEVAAAPPGWQELTPDERAVVDNLDLLMALEEVDDLEVIEAMDALEDLSEEELGEG